MVIGAEALRTIGTHGLLGDLMFVGAGLSFATFGMLLRLWRITPMRAVGGDERRVARLPADRGADDRVCRIWSQPAG